MAALVVGLGAFGGLWYLSRQEQIAPQPDAGHPYENSDAAANRFMTTGTYIDMAQVAAIIGDRGTVVAEKVDVDITGVPCRWLLLKSGATVKTFDMRTEYLK